MRFSVLRKQVFSQAFTLVEMMVSIAIFMILATIMLDLQQRLNDETRVRNVAYELAQTIREAQVYGINSLQRGTTSVDAASYGVRFSAVPGANQEVILFEDSNKDTMYHSTGLDVIVEKKLLPGNVGVRSISNSGCGPGSDNSLVDIVFKRPFPDAIINPGGVAVKCDTTTIQIADLANTNLGQWQFTVRGTGQITSPIIVP